MSGAGLIIDYFAGGGGASEAMETAYGRKVDIAINHDAKALAMHAANHPETLHIEDDVFAVDIAKVCAGRPIDVAWFSPDCTHHSRAKGGKPRSNRRRGLAWVVLKVAALPKWQRPRVIHLENVPEFADWGPLTKDGFPDRSKRGETFRLWVSHLEALGYAVEWRRLKACDYGAPTIRDRLFLTARSDGRPIRWPEPTHENPKTASGRAPELRLALRKPWRAAAEIIDWSLPCPSIFLSAVEGRRAGVKRPLKENTLRRIARGVWRYVVNNPSPFIIPVTHGGDARFHPLAEPLRTVTTAKGGEFALVAPTLISTRNGEREGQRPRARSLADPAPTVTAKGSQGALVAPLLVVNRNSGKPWQGADEPAMTITASGAHLNLVAAFLAQFNNDRNGPNPGNPVGRPLSTVASAGPHQALACAHLLNLKGSDRRDAPADVPAPAICAGGGHVAEVRAFLLKYYGNEKDGASIAAPLGAATTKDRFGLVRVSVAGVDYAIADIGLRMLSPRELFRAQGFRDDYLIDVECGGRRLSKADQIEKVGNSVSPPPAAALARINAPWADDLSPAARCEEAGDEAA